MKFKFNSSIFWLIVIRIISVVCLSPSPKTLTTRENSHQRLLSRNDQIFLFRFFKYFDNVRRNLSESCLESYDYFRKHSHQEWAMKMIDANSIVEPGLMDGNLQFFGGFDECIGLKIEATKNLPLMMNRNIQYCTIHFPISFIMSKNESDQYPSYILLMAPPAAGICLPAGCSAQHDLPIILNELSEDNYTSFEVSQCITETDLNISNRIETIHLVIISVFLFIVLMIILGSFVEQSEKLKNSKNSFSQFFRCFGLGRNLSYLFNISPQTKRSASNKPIRAPQIYCLHGIRVLSFLFILIYHTFTEAQVPSANLLKILGAEHDFLYQLITNAALWVDTFFLLSGFLMAHSSLYQSKVTKNQSSTWDSLSQHPKRIFHRYIRLTPSVIGIIGLSILIEILGSGPMWHNYIQLSRQSCHTNWWNVLLYMNNFCNLNTPSNPKNECLSYLWYLAVDMQFFIISPLLIMFLTNRSQHMQNIGIVINFAFIFFSSILTAFLMAWKHLTPTILVTVYDLDYINLVYKASYCRIGPYCIGVLMAYFLRRHQLKRQDEYLVNFNENDDNDDENCEKNYCGNWKTGFLLLTISISLMLTTTLLTYPWLQGSDYYNAPSILYGSIHRCVWAFAWALFIWSLARGHLPLIDRIFSSPLLQTFSKLTYQSYLLHSVLIGAVVNSVRQKIYFSEINFTLDVIRYFFLSQIISIMTFVMFERPFINIKMTFISQQKPQNKPSEIDESSIQQGTT